MDNIWAWVGAVVLTMLLIGGIVFFDGRGTETGSVNVAESVATVTGDEHVLGPETASVTLIEYSDFQCPACGQYFPILKQLKAQFGDDLRFVYRHFPLTSLHSNADLAGRAAEAAHQQGQFWPMHDRLFLGQGEWSSLSSEEATTRLTAYAQELGLDPERFKADLDADSIKAAVTDDERSARVAGASGTPTFILNGQRIQTPATFDAFAAVIEAARNEPRE